MELESFSAVLLLRGPKADDFTDDELAELQRAHLEYMDGLRGAGKLAVNGPFVDQEDERLRGLCVYSVGLEEARELAAGDPSVRAGRMVAQAFTWLAPPGLVRFGR